MKKKNYRIQDGCWNCIHTYVLHQYDEESKIHCILNNTSKRPLSGYRNWNDDTLNEDFGKGLDKNDPKYHNKCYKKMTEWERWSKKHSVDTHGICDYHKTK